LACSCSTANIKKYEKRERKEKAFLIEKIKNFKSFVRIPKSTVNKNQVT